MLRHKALKNFFYDRGIAVVDDLGPKEAAELGDLMVVSDSAKKYAIAAALYDANSWHMHLRVMLIPAATYLSGGAIVHMLANHKGLSHLSQIKFSLILPPIQGGQGVPFAEIKLRVSPH